MGGLMGVSFLTVLLQGSLEREKKESLSVGSFGNTLIIYFVWENKRLGVNTYTVVCHLKRTHVNIRKYLHKSE
jgi:hypothetical protein